MKKTDFNYITFILNFVGGSLLILGIVFLGNLDWTLVILVAIPIAALFFVLSWSIKRTQVLERKIKLLEKEQ